MRYRFAVAMDELPQVETRENRPQQLKNLNKSSTDSWKVLIWRFTSDLPMAVVISKELSKWWGKISRLDKWKLPVQTYAARTIPTLMSKFYHDVNS